MVKLKKVIIPVAGLGTRMLPATKVIPKELLPLAGMPIIHYIVKEAIDAGFSEVIFITREDKFDVKNYFKSDPNLESALKKQFKKSLLKEIKEISSTKTKIVNVEQKEPKGLGHAILCAKSLISEDPFAVMLPDMILDSNYKKNNLVVMKKDFEKTGESSLLLGQVKKSDIQNYGIAKFKKRNINYFFPLEDIVEKPTLKNAPSNLFVVGRYVFDNDILNFLEREKPDLSGEIQLTGAISKFIKSSKKVKGFLINGDAHDCGNKLGYLIANLALSFKDKIIKREVLKYLKK